MNNNKLGVNWLIIIMQYLSQQKTNMYCLCVDKVKYCIFM